ncbi:MAG TPA: Co2+/Mg2+ efflux protein ApaG [Zoogloea sp.]|uniref:Co2+/Mg2+ efflux protein ApaG n=1 Tax=Zoogloea sp. TaxID=49181 RepID=UPI002C033124|nr:Co2+/Mg2+ efflux protein ApaG [Zoogloea sp.]HMV17093.1 Co2+/Mg2+ efflux protein ApaG [Rhodocyclaceae bacterium]HMV64014.1 Co2+/Mg2+ efflux protein ApaG [Rhodocyclaceae bacterium]HMW51378.1 Co2+/Mg2+ efflux protein ApaG [Rhodocyclaceae bacterium]HMY49702.1 Co2+/Mg2+ efflux protein ApaG [Rhodocyclaceae bacterium]HMZ75838.1 Co2+/Mg2+ efflux protein ApaG [Rhodocyclaceae bacterium]
MTTLPDPDSIQVKAVARYLADQSDEAADRYVFAYHITIRNTGDAPAQLLSRHWIITDAHGTIQEVEGSGVIGQQPTLKPGEAFEYTSGCVLTTPVGTMKGSYRMQTEDGVDFNATIPEFTLAMPRTLH